MDLCEPVENNLFVITTIVAIILGIFLIQFLIFLVYFVRRKRKREKELNQVSYIKTISVDNQEQELQNANGNWILKTREEMELKNLESNI